MVKADQAAGQAAQRGWSSPRAARITSQLKYAELPGNVRLRKGEAGLPRPSVANVTQIATVDRALLGARLGALSAARLAEVWAGVRLVCEPGDP